MSKVWVKLNDKPPVKVDVRDDADVDDLIKEVIKLMMLQYPPQNCEMKGPKGAEIRRGMMVSDLLASSNHGKSDLDPLILHVRPEGKSV